MGSLQLPSRESVIQLLEISVITFDLHICEIVINNASVLQDFTNLKMLNSHMKHTNDTASITH